ncbi:MAG: hypothetical protein ACLGJB_25810 [Blastocatellia bacterium]
MNSPGPMPSLPNVKTTLASPGGLGFSACGGFNVEGTGTDTCRAGLGALREERKAKKTAPKLTAIATMIMIG